ncbi:MAG: Fpg/Nei family DNA glycosylase [Micrococcales bacterium]|nr:Fpg/Nei family DNA glycosylase [Micrococcales bacterium]
MPEGHTIHRLARALDDAFTGSRPEVTSPQGRFADGAARLDGRDFLGAMAWGKHLFAEFAGEQWLHVHLGLIGKFSVIPGRYAAPPPIEGQVRLRLLTGGAVADLRGPNLCAVVTPGDVEAVTGRLGADPLRADPDADAAYARIRRSRRPIGELLMDQSIVAGIGNLYRCEVLFRHRVDPHTPGTQLRPATWQALWDDIVDLLGVGVVMGQIVTMDDQLEDLRPLIVAGQRPEPVERRFYVYKRTGEPCRVCGTRIRTELAAGRNLFWCPRCQRRH